MKFRCLARELQPGATRHNSAHFIRSPCADNRGLGCVQVPLPSEATVKRLVEDPPLRPNWASPFRPESATSSGERGTMLLGAGMIAIAWVFGAMLLVSFASSGSPGELFGAVHARELHTQALAPHTGVALAAVLLIAIGLELPVAERPMGRWLDRIASVSSQIRRATQAAWRGDFDG